MGEWPEKEQMKEKKLTKWQWLMIVIGAILVIGILSGPSGTVDTQKNTEVAKAVGVKDAISNEVEPLSFTFPDQNAKVTMQCVTPGSHDGFTWEVTSLDGKNPPTANKIYFNMAKSKSNVIVASAWRGIISKGDKVPVGDAFMITAFQLKDNLAKEGFKYFVFGVANSLEEVQASSKAVFIPVDLVVMTSALTLNQHPCSTQNK
jgi:hypothetical protein